MSISYEVIGNFIRQSREGSTALYPILDRDRYSFNSDMTQILGIKNANGASIELSNGSFKPSHTEFTANVLKVLGISASGGRRSRKTRRRRI